MSRARITIVSRSSEPFKDRTQAGRLLAKRLVYLRGKRAIVLGIPRGGIIVAQALASGIGADLDISSRESWERPDRRACRVLGQTRTI